MIQKSRAVTHLSSIPWLRIRSVLAPLWAIGLLWLGQAAAQDHTYAVRLSTVPIDLETKAHVTGRGSASAVLSGSRLSITGSFEGLSGPATEARLHEGPVTGVRGSAIFDLIVTTAPSGEITGSVDLSPEQIQALGEGRLYIQIHSEPATEGNLWGWLL